MTFTIERGVTVRGALTADDPRLPCIGGTCAARLARKTRKEARNAAFKVTLIGLGLLDFGDALWASEDNSLIARITLMF